jgi:hypothetical protein
MAKPQSHRFPDPVSVTVDELVTRPDVQAVAEDNPELVQQLQNKQQFELDEANKKKNEEKKQFNDATFELAAMETQLLKECILNVARQQEEKAVRQEQERKTDEKPHKEAEIASQQSQAQLQQEQRKEELIRQQKLQEIIHKHEKAIDQLHKQIEAQQAGIDKVKDKIDALAKEASGAVFEKGPHTIAKSPEAFSAAVDNAFDKKIAKISANIAEKEQQKLESDKFLSGLRQERSDIRDQIKNLDGQIASEQDDAKRNDLKSERASLQARVEVLDASIKKYGAKELKIQAELEKLHAEKVKFESSKQGVADKAKAMHEGMAAEWKAMEEEAAFRPPSDRAIQRGYDAEREQGRSPEQALPEANRMGVAVGRLENQLMATSRTRNYYSNYARQLKETFGMSLEDVFGPGATAMSLARTHGAEQQKIIGEYQDQMAKLRAAEQSFQAATEAVHQLQRIVGSLTGEAAEVLQVPRDQLARVVSADAGRLATIPEAPELEEQNQTVTQTRSFRADS